jgi:hypothetical protein
VVTLRSFAEFEALYGPKGRRRGDRRRGGFRTRDRVLRARAAWSVLRALPSVLRNAVEGDYEAQLDSIARQEHQRCCPHPPEERRGATVGFIDCKLCGMTLCARGHWNVWPVDEPDTCTCGIEYRQALWTGKETTPPGGFLGPDGEKGWDSPQHYEHCPQTWMAGAEADPAEPVA